MLSWDPIGVETRVEYDQHDLLPALTINAVGLRTTATYDYRVLSARETTDPNGNTTTVRFSPAGMVTAQFVRGKFGEGDRDVPRVRMIYDIRGFVDRGVPASVRTIRREHHDSEPDVEDGQRDDVLVSVEYSDGFGRVVQTRTQAEDIQFGDPTFGGAVIPADQLAAVGNTTGRTRETADNVVVSGWQIYDNKGRVVQKYEPFFATDYDYAPPRDTQLGQKATMFYDPRGQVVRTVNPDGSEQRVVHGIPTDLTNPDVFAPTPWEAYTYDANDNAGRTHPDAAGSYRDHWNTPVSIEIDALGRTVVAVARNGVAATDRLITRTTYDIQGNPVAITDPLGREAFRYSFDLAKRRWRMDSIDAGCRDTVPDAAGTPVEARDSNGSLTLATFDLLHRPSAVWARDDATDPVTMRQRVDYGDAGPPNQRPAERAGARNRNLLGLPVHHHDEAGLASVDSVDFKGNTVQSTRRVIADAPILATYDQAATNGWQVAPFRVDWTPKPGQTQTQRDAELLEPGGYVTSSQHDALNRVKRTFLPFDTDGKRHLVYFTYSRSGALERVQLDNTVHVQHIAYDAKGQRTLIAYGNGVMTRHAYDPHTFRLARLRTEHYNLTNTTTYRRSGPVLQDYGYDYDLVGNILAIHDRAPGSGIPNNPDALTATDTRLRALLGSGDALDRRFTYDPTYRLLSATGREHQAPPDGDPWPDQPRGTDITQTQPYTERYQYDSAGNILRLAHAAEGGFTRDFTVGAGSNRLRRMTIGTTPYDYTFDANGNLTAETSTRHFTWNHGDQLSAFATQTAGAEPSIHAHYLYDPAGQRIKKLVRRQGGAVEVTHYLNEVFEHHRWSGGQNNHVHVMDDLHRVALHRIGSAHPDDRGPATAFHLADHLGSSTAVVNDTGTLTNREEHTPYGETSFARKRYRFTGQERDEESGLGYHSARYFLSWAARWATVDPLCHRFADRSPYEYAASNPIRLTDGSGEEPQTLTETQRQTIAEVEGVVGQARSFAQDNLGGFRQLQRDAALLGQQQAEMQMHGQDVSPLAKRIANMKAQLQRATELDTQRRLALNRVKSSFPADSVPNFREVPYRHLLTARLEEALANTKYGTGSRPMRGGPGGTPGPGGTSGARPVERAPSRLGGGGGRFVRGGVGVAGALAVIDAAGDIYDDATHGHGWRAVGKTTELGATTAASFTAAAPVAIAYGVARTYWADRENIDDAAGEAADHLVGRDHPIIGGVIAAGYAVGVSVGRTAAGAGTSVAHGATRVYHFFSSIFD